MSKKLGPVVGLVALALAMFFAVGGTPQFERESGAVPAPADPTDPQPQPHAADATLSVIPPETDVLLDVLRESTPLEERWGEIEVQLMQPIVAQEKHRGFDSYASILPRRRCGDYVLPRRIEVTVLLEVPESTPLDDLQHNCRQVNLSALEWAGGYLLAGEIRQIGAESGKLLDTCRLYAERRAVIAVLSPQGI